MILSTTCSRAYAGDLAACLAQSVRVTDRSWRSLCRTRDFPSPNLYGGPIFSGNCASEIRISRSSLPRAGSCGAFATSCRRRSPRECNGTARSRGMSREIDSLPPKPTVHSPHSEISDEPGTTGKSSGGMTISVTGEDCNVKAKCRKSSTLSNFATESRS
jgi:hypothetical protein